MKVGKSIVIVSCVVLLAMAINSYAQVPKSGSGRDAANFISMRERVKMMEKFWAWKKKNVLLKIMREQGVDMWIIRNDEEPLYRQTSYREHPVYLSLLPANHEGMVIPSKFAQRSMDVPETLIFFDTGSKIEYLEPKDFAELTQMVRKRDPKKIAISKKNLYIRKQKIGDSEQISVITSDEMQRALGSKYAARTVDSLHLGILWLSIIGPEQRSAYRYVQGVQNDILAEAFSNRVILPNVTTIEDLNWWIRHRYRDLHLDIDNHPTVVVLRRPSKIAEYPESAKYFRRGRAGNGSDVIIRRGDIVGLDSDILLLGLETDSQQFAYVLQEGETDVPESLKEALRLMNEMIDAYRKAYVVGRTAEEIQEAGNTIKPHDPRILRARFGFHPLPMYIRRFSKNGLQFSRGTYVAGIGHGYKQHPLHSPTLTLHYNTLYAHEPSFTFAVPEWGEDGVSFATEQAVVFTERGCEYLDRANLEWHVIK
ncbi:MAG: hypothetical protein WBE11_16370 [Candidatus Aminicenantaceae bacterium]